MGKAALIQTDFTAGELSTRLAARVDLPAYKKGLETCQNAIVLPQGGAMRRSGFEFIYAALGASILVPFEYSTTQAYILEFSNNKIRVYKDGAIVISGTPVVITTTYTTAQLPALRFCQSANTLYIVHPAHMPATLTRSSDIAWTLADMTFAGGPVRTANATEIGLEPSATTGSITLRTANIVSNGTFTSNLMGWSDQSAGTGDASQTSGKMRLLGQGAGNECISSCSIIVQPSTTYQLTLDGVLVAGPGTLYTYVSTDFGYATKILNEDETASGSYTYTFTTGASTSLVYLTFYTNHNYWTVDNVVCRPQYFTAGMAGTIFKLNQASATETMQVNATVVGAVTATMTLQTGELIVELAGDAVAWGVGTFDLQASYDGAITWNTIAQYSGPTRVRIVDTTEDVKYRLYLSAFTSGVCIGRIMQSISISSGVVLASAYVDAYSMTGTVQDAFPNTSGTIDWADGAWSAIHGYPSTVTFYENRLMFGGTTDDPQTVWGSQTDDYSNFGTTADAADSEAVTYMLLSRQMTAIRWLEPGDRLLIGTAGAEWWISGATYSEPLTPSSVRARADTYHGSAACPTARVEDAVLFVDRSGRKILRTAWDYNVDKYVPQDIGILAEHLTAQYTVTDLAFQRSPVPVLWAVRSDGRLLGVTMNSQHEIMGWHTHVTDGTVESIASIPGTNRDELWAVVNRTSGRCVERLAIDFWDSTDCEDGLFVDSFVVYNGWNTTTTKYLKVAGASYADGATVTLTATGHTPFTTPGSLGKYYRLRSGSSVVDFLVVAYTSSSVVTGVLVGTAASALQNTNTADWALMAATLSGLTHLEGKSVQVLEDGAVAPNATVASGAITFSGQTAKAVAGLQYITDLKTMRPEGGSMDGSSQGRQKAIREVVFRFFQTRGGKVGMDADHLETLPFDQLDGSDYSGIALPVYSTDMDMDFPGDLERGGQMLIRQDQPLPFTLLGFVLHVDVKEK